MDLRRVSETCDHLVEQQRRPVQVIELEIGDAQQVPVLEGRTGDYSSFQVLPGRLVVCLLEQRASKRVLGCCVVRRPLDGLFSQRPGLSQLSFLQPHCGVIQTYIWLVRR